MSTRSRIGIDKGDGVIRSIYCHFDGYPEGVGAVLRDHYRLVNKADKLIRLGDISTLGPEPVSSPENWDLGTNPFYEGTTLTLAYRDRPGEKNFKARTCEGYDKFFDLCAGVDYAYVFDPKKKDWKAYTASGRELGWVSEVVK